jgi:hypothetical protein
MTDIMQRLYILLIILADKDRIAWTSYLSSSGIAAWIPLAGVLTRGANAHILA